MGVPRASPYGRRSTRSETKRAEALQNQIQKSARDVKKERSLLESKASAQQLWVNASLKGTGASAKTGLLGQENYSLGAAEGNSNLAKVEDEGNQQGVNSGAQEAQEAQVSKNLAAGSQGNPEETQDSNKGFTPINSESSIPRTPSKRKRGRVPLLGSPVVDRRTRIKKVAASPEEELRLIRNANAVRRSRERYRAAKVAAEERHASELASMEAATEAADKEFAAAQAELGFYTKAVERLEAESKALSEFIEGAAS